MKLAAAAVLAAALTITPAGHQPPPASTVRTPAGLCLTATSSVPGSPAVLDQCLPGSADQAWAFTPAGRLRLYNANEYLTTGPAGTVLGSWRAAPSFLYEGDELVSAGEWLTWCESAATRQPWLQAASEPECQVFDVLGG